MHFDLIDTVLECSDDHIVAIKHVSNAEEYLKDHFPTYPVLPGVMMIETMTQAARHVIARHSETPMVLGQVKALKFSGMVRPGQSLQVTVTLMAAVDDDTYRFKCVGSVRNADETGVGETALSGRFTMRPLGP